MEKILELPRLLEMRRLWKDQGKTVVFTNGCFDLLHPGHVYLFRQAIKLGDILVVAVNDDASIRRIKGPSRPIFPLEERLEVLEAVAAVDHLVSFAEDTPREIISRFLPDVLVKGGDWSPEEVVGRKDVETAGGRVVIIPFLPHHSSSDIIQRILRLSQKK